MSTDDTYEEEVEAPSVEEEEVITENENEEEQEQEVITEPEPKPNNLASINAKRNVNKKANSIRFFVLFSQNPDKGYTEIAKSIGISKEVARKYLNELVGVVISCINNDTYPIGVLKYYNDASIPPQQRLTAGHLQGLKSVLIRYNDTNIDSLLAQKEETEPIPITEEQILINNAVDSEIQQEEESNIVTPFKKFNEFKERQEQFNTNPRVINENSPISDVIEFGIKNAGVPDMAKIKRIKTMFMSSPNFYLMDETKFVELLESNGIKDKSLSTFMNWFKNVAPIKPSERVGFLNFQKIQAQQVPQNGNNGGRFNNFNISDYDDLAQFLYHEGVYSYGYPPNHPMNVQAYRRYQEDKRMEEEERKMTRQFNMAMKKQMMEMSMGGGMLGNRMGMGVAGGQNNPNIAFDERYLIERGIVTPEITYDENGNRSVRLVPTGRSLYDTQPQQQKTDSFTESLNTFARVVDAVRPMMMTNQQGGGTQNPIMDKVLTVMLERLMNKVEEDPSKVVHNQLSLLNEVKTLFPQPENKSLSNEDIKLQIELAKINNDKVFSLKEIELKEKHHELELKRIDEGKDDSKNNIEMIMGWLEKGFRVFEPILSKILLGQFGGGLSNMIPGMGGAGGGGMGDIMGGGGLDTSGGLFPQQGSDNSQFIPQQQPYQPTMNDFIPQQQPTPMDFPPQPDFSNQQFQPQQPQQQYNPQQYIPQQVIEQPSSGTSNNNFNEGEEEQQAEDNFIDTVSESDLETLSVSELDDIVNRFETKASKFERVLNLAKSTKARKQFGYSSPSQPKRQKQNNYSVLDIPSDMNADYDGVDDNNGDEGGTTAAPVIEIPPQ